MTKIGSHMRATVAVLGAIVIMLLAAATAAAAIESEGEMFSRDRLIGNLGVAHADVGVYPDRAESGTPAPERNGGTDTLTVPDGAEIVETVVYWAGRGPGWTNDTIQVNGVSVTADIDYHWTGPGWDQTTYIADLEDAGVTFNSGSNTVTISGIDHQGERGYGAGVIVVYEDPSLPEVELELFEGNEFAFFNDTFSDEIGNSAVHTAVSCVEFAPSIEERTSLSFSRIMGVDAGRSDAPPRTQRVQHWVGTEVVTAPVTDGLVGIPSAAPAQSVDNPITPKVPSTSSWGSDVYETDIAVPAGDTHVCTQVQSVSIGDGDGASLSLTNQGGMAETVHRIGNLVWLDSNDDGMADAGEPGIDGVTVDLIKVGSDTPIASTVTSDDGEYLFDGLLCGTYKVSIPAGQNGWTVDGEAVDPAKVMPGTVNNPDANDDNDNDNNGVESNGMVMSGEVEIGDCGEDGDFSNSASNEPTNEVDRKGGPDDDADEVSVADGNYDDVRSNVSVDFSFVANECVADEDGNFPDGAVNADGEACTSCDATDPGPGAVDADGEPCVEHCGDDAGPDAVDADGVACNPCGDDAGADAVDADGVACNPCGDDAGPDAVDADGVACNPCGDDAGPDAVDANGEPCNPPCDDDAAAANGVNADGTPCTPPCGDNPTPGAVDQNGNLCDEEDPVDVEVEGQVECPGDSARAGEVIEPGESCEETELVIPVEVEGLVEENPDVGDQAQVPDDDTPGDEAQLPGDEAVDQAQVPGDDLAATGTSASEILTLVALMAAVLGVWFFVASAWMRPAGRRR